MVQKLVLGLILLSIVSGFTQWDGIEYTINESSLTFAWDQSEGATHYKVRAIWIDPTGEFIYDQGTIVATQLVIQRPRAGHFRFEVAACNESECSDYAVSSDATYGTVDGIPNGWRVYWRVAPPTGPVIE